MEKSFIQIRDLEPSKKTFPTKLRMNPKIILIVLVYDVFEMFKILVKLHLIFRMFENGFRIVPNRFRLFIRIYKNVLRMEPTCFQLMTNVLWNDLEIMRNVMQ